MKAQEKREPKERRPLVAGLSPIDRAVEEEFVYGTKANPEQAAPAPAAPPSEARDGQGQSAGAISRVPFTTRIRADFAAALKRASLQRQLDGKVPNTLQDILEEALEPWLHNNDYLS